LLPTENVARDIQYGAIKRAAELAKQQSALLVRFRTIGDRAKDPNKPLNQQLSQSDLAEFAQVQQRFQSIELQQLLESNYSRDNLVIEKTIVFLTTASANRTGQFAVRRLFQG
jgi:ribosome biogenesis protein Tsr3